MAEGNPMSDCHADFLLQIDPYIKAIVRRFARSGLPASLSHEDLDQVGRLAAWTVLPRVTPDGWKPLVGRRVQGAVIDELRQQGGNVRSIAGRAKWRAQQPQYRYTGELAAPARTAALEHRLVWKELVAMGHRVLPAYLYQTLRCFEGADTEREISIALGLGPGAGSLTRRKHRLVRLLRSYVADRLSPTNGKR